MIRSLARLPRAAVRRGALGCLVFLLACGDDSGDEGTVTGPMASTSAATPATTTGEATSTGLADGSSSGGTTSGSSGGATTGAAEDPAYPMPDGESCEGNTAPVTLPGAEVCAPFCADAGDACPAGSSGDAPAECTPFLGAGGSGDPCDDMTPCAMGEACGTDGTCGEVTFWACQLVCGDGQTCPDGMICAGTGTCGYA